MAALVACGPVVTCGPVVSEVLNINRDTTVSSSFTPLNLLCLNMQTSVDSNIDSALVSATIAETQKPVSAWF
jgi:hypothetical protein